MTAVVALVIGLLSAFAPTASATCTPEGTTGVCVGARTRTGITLTNTNDEPVDVQLPAPPNGFRWAATLPAGKTVFVDLTSWFSCHALNMKVYALDETEMPVELLGMTTIPACPTTVQVPGTTVIESVDMSRFYDNKPGGVPTLWYKANGRAVTVDHHYGYVYLSNGYDVGPIASFSRLGSVTRVEFQIERPDGKIAIWNVKRDRDAGHGSAQSFGADENRESLAFYPKFTDCPLVRQCLGQWTVTMIASDEQGIVRAARSSHFQGRLQSSIRRPQVVSFKRFGKKIRRTSERPKRHDAHHSLWGFDWKVRVRVHDPDRMIATAAAGLFWSKSPRGERASTFMTGFRRQGDYVTFTDRIGVRADSYGCSKIWPRRGQDRDDAYGLSELATTIPGRKTSITFKKAFSAKVCVKRRAR